MKLNDSVRSKKSCSSSARRVYAPKYQNTNFAHWCALIEGKEGARKEKRGQGRGIGQHNLDGNFLMDFISPYRYVGCTTSVERTIPCNFPYKVMVACLIKIIKKVLPSLWRETVSGSRLVEARSFTKSITVIFVYFEHKFNFKLQNLF